MSGTLSVSVRWRRTRGKSRQWLPRPRGVIETTQGVGRVDVQPRRWEILPTTVEELMTGRAVVCCVGFATGDLLTSNAVVCNGTAGMRGVGLDTVCVAGLAGWMCRGEGVQVTAMPQARATT